MTVYFAPVLDRPLPAIDLDSIGAPLFERGKGVGERSLLSNDTLVFSAAAASFFVSNGSRAPVATGLRLAIGDTPTKARWPIAGTSR
jgi:hypothetical protein